MLTFYAQQYNIAHTAVDKNKNSMLYMDMIIFFIVVFVVAK
jgi:hypothetical protein